MSNILFVGAGRRVELANRFIERGYNIFSYELNKKVPISEVATIIIGKKWTDPAVLHELINTISAHKIDLVIPLMDGALPICAKLREAVACPVVVSNHITSLTCYDKEAFERFMLSSSLAEFYPKWDGTFPIIIKPKFGSASMNIYTINTGTEFETFFKTFSMDNFVIQKKIEGIEYSIDSYFNHYGSFIDAIPRERVRVGSGEVVTSCTVENESLVTLAKALGTELGIRGPCNIQVIVYEGKPYVIEVNARFGGGWTFSMEAGLDAISLIEKNYLGKTFEYKAGKWKRDLLLERSYSDHYFET